jgi:hypothetical protein
MRVLIKSQLCDCLGYRSGVAEDFVIMGYDAAPLGIFFFHLFQATLCLDLQGPKCSKRGNLAP